MLTSLKNKGLSFIAAILFLFITSPVLIYSQQHKPADRTLHHEVKDDDYIPVNREQQNSSPAYRYSMSNITTVQVNVNSNGQNIVGDAANEPSIAIDRNNYLKMVIGWRQFNSKNSNFRQAGYGYTTNGGTTWHFPGVIQAGTFRSDPVLGSDAQGNFYYNSLTNTPDYFCKVFKSTSGGSAWDNGVDAHGGDKQWMVIDNSGGTGDGNIYSFWTDVFSTCQPGFFTRSTNRGASFQNCIAIPSEPYWGTLAVNSLGDLYIAGTTGWDFMIAKSVNARNPLVIPTWSLTSVVSLDGAPSSYIDPNPGGLGGQTNISIDTSGGPYNNYVYVLSSVDRNSNSDPADVMFARSTDGGITFSSPVRVNDDAGTSAYQWFSTMSVAPNGRIDVIWLDTRDHPGTNLSALYYSKSTNAGLTWSQNKRLSDYFDPHVGWPQQNKMGDYFHMISDINGAHLAWAATFNGEQDVYYSYISDSVNVPVELTSFSAASGNNGVNLNWSTATETNNRGFEIERSSDRMNWITIGFKEGKGTTSEGHEYSFSDNPINAATAKFYYRLKQIDYNGSFEYSDIAETQSLINYNFILSQNYPNPFNPVTSIRYQVPVNGLVSLKVYNILGKELATLVKEEKSAGSYEVQFDAANLSSGVYFYRLQAGEYSSTKRMVLMK